MSKHAHYGDAVDTYESQTLVHDHADPESLISGEHDIFDSIYHTVVCDEICAEPVGLTVEALNTVLERLTDYEIEACALFVEHQTASRARIALAIIEATSNAVSLLVKYASVEIDTGATVDRVYANREISQ